MKEEFYKPFEDEITGEVTTEGWNITDDRTAEWALKKVKAEREEHERLIALAQAEIDELQDKIAKQKEEMERATSYLTYQLRLYFDKVNVKETKTQQSYKLLSGSLVRKKPTQKLAKTSDEQLVSFFEISGMDDLIKIEKKPNWAEYKKRLAIIDGTVIDTTTGEMVDCVEIEEVPEQFDIKF